MTKRMIALLLALVLAMTIAVPGSLAIRHDKATLTSDFSVQEEPADVDAAVEDDLPGEAAEAEALSTPQSAEPILAELSAEIPVQGEGQAEPAQAQETTGTTEPAEETPAQPEEPQEETQEEPAEPILVTSADETVSVYGTMPEGTVLEAEQLNNPFAAGGVVNTLRNLFKAPARGAAAESTSYAELNYLGFYDLKLYDNDVQVQPDGTVLVTIRGIAVPESGSIQIIHILDDAQAIRRGIEAQTVTEVTEQAFVEKFPAEAQAAYEAVGAENTVYIETMSTASGTVYVLDGATIQFYASSFSIYAIVDDGVEVPRATFRFKNTDDSQYFFTNTAGETADNQIVKTGDTVEDVGTPDVPDGQTYQGWFIYLNGQPALPMSFGKTVTVSFGDTKTITTDAEGNLTITITDSDREFEVKPFYGDVYFYTFFDDVEGNVILSMVQLPKSTDPANPTTFEFNTVGSATVKDPTVAFVGWTTTKGGDRPEYTPYTNNSGLPTKIDNVTENKTFYPVFWPGYWVEFVSAPEGSGATYIAPVFVPNGVPVSDMIETPPVPEWKNHTFQGWYTHDAEGNEVAPFDWNQTLSGDVTVYGKWKADDIKYTVSYWKQNVTDDKNATGDGKTYSFFTQEVRTAPAGTRTVYLEEGDKTKPTTDKDNYGGFVFNAEKTAESIALAEDGSTNLKVYYDRVTITMNFIGLPGGTETIYNYTATESETASPQYGQVNGRYLELTRGDPEYSYRYNRYTGTNYTNQTLYGTTDNVNYFELEVGTRTESESILTKNQNDNTPYSGTIYYNQNGGVVTWTPAPGDGYTYYWREPKGGCGGGYDYYELHWSTRNVTVYTFTNKVTGEVYGTSKDLPALFTQTVIETRPWLYDGQVYTGARYIRGSVAGTGVVYTGLYGQTLEQNGYSWPGDDGNGNAYYWQYDNDEDGRTGMSYLGEFVLPDGVADENGQIINFHFTTLEQSARIEFFLMDTEGNYPSTPSDYGIVSAGGTFNFSEKYDGFNVRQYRRYYMDGNTKVYIDKDGNTTANPDDAWATATVDGQTPLYVVRKAATPQYYWVFRSSNGTEYQYSGKRYVEDNRNYSLVGYRVTEFNDNGTFYPNDTPRGYREVTNNNGTQYGLFYSENGNNYMAQIYRIYGYPNEQKYCNLEIRYARKQYNLMFVDSLDGQSSLTDETTGQTIRNARVYYNEELAAYQPAETVHPKCSTAGMIWDGKWYKDQGCTTEFEWSDNMPNADLKVYAGWEQQWFYVKLIPDGCVLRTSQATYFWETYGEKVTEYANITKNFVENAAGPYVYYFGEFDTTFGGTDDRDAPQATYRYALYFTNDGSKVVIENADGTITESAMVTAYRNKTDGQGNNVYDGEGNIVQEPYEIPARTIYDYGVQNGFIDTSHHYKYEKDAYALVGWYDVTDGGRKVYSFEGGVTRDTVLQAVWRRVGEFKVGYSNAAVDQNGMPLDPVVLVTHDVSDPNTYADNSGAVIVGIPSTVPSGYAFLGWYYDGEVLNKGDAFTVKAGQYADADKTIWLKPVLVPVEQLPVEVTHITYDGNGGTTTVTSDEINHVTVNDEKTQITDGTLQVNATQTLRGEDTFTRYGYTLLGWAFTPNATTPKFAFGQEVGADNLDVTGNTLYAVWQVKTYTVTIEKTVPNVTNDPNTFAFSDPSFNPLISSYQGTYSLKSGESKEYLEVPYGTTFTVREDNYVNYDTVVTYTVTDADDTTKNVTNQASTNGATYTVDGNITVKVENTMRNTNLTITKSGAQDVDENQTFIFKIQGTDEGVNDGVSLTVTVHGNGSVAIKDLPVGHYTITEVSDWSFRYDFTSASLNGTAVSGNGATVELTGQSNNYVVTNTRTNDNWLSGDSFAVNVAGTGRKN